EATKRGAYGYVPKPFTPDEVLLPIRRGLERRSLVRETEGLQREREQRLLEVAFERSKCNTIINCMADGVLVVNREGRLVLHNAAAARVLPSGRAPASPCPPQEAVQVDQLRDLVSSVLRSDSGQQIASREVDLDGITFLASASPVLDSDDALLGAVIVLRDITDLKDLETAKSMLVSMVAHEVKGPLATVEGYVNAVLEELDGLSAPEQVKSMLLRARQRSRTLRLMVSELINLTAIETGRFTLDRKPLCPAEVAQEVVAGQRAQAEQKGVELSLSCEEATRRATVLADAGALTSVIANLIDNAIKYTPPGGHVRVRLREAGRQFLVEVEDDGMGIAPEDQERIFEEFYRVRNPRTAEIPGTGLGLSLARRLVDLHHGTITVESSPGEGSTFTVSLPTMETPGDV
ncbi:MAG: ATP-binding protein, partial [Candidatus Brocadiia bacterium]